MKCPVPKKWREKLPWQFQTPDVHALVAAVVVVVALIVFVALFGVQ